MEVSWQWVADMQAAMQLACIASIAILYHCDQNSNSVKT